MRIGLYAGSFCPVTKGHVNAIEHASHLTDKLYVVMGVNANKQYVIPQKARLDMLKRALEHLPNVEVIAYDGMMIDCCKRLGVSVMIKSIRNAMDLQSVIDLADVNSSYWNGETVFVVSDKEYRHISSSLVRELAGLGQDFKEFVPECCAEDITKYLVGK